MYSCVKLHQAFYRLVKGKYPPVIRCWLLSFESIESILNKSKFMNFIYRGNTYNYNHIKVKSLFPVQSRTKLIHKLMYRGSTYLFDPNIVPVKPISYQLTYRGNTYQSN